MSAYDTQVHNERLAKPIPHLFLMNINTAKQQAVTGEYDNTVHTPYAGIPSIKKNI